MRTSHQYDRRYRGSTRRRGYDRALARRYDRDYDRDNGRYLTPFPGAHGYPAARWGWGPIGWAAWPGWGVGMEFTPPFDEVPWYAYDGTVEAPRRRPQESPTYGRGGDRAARAWSRRYGYDIEHTIRPRIHPSNQEYR